MRTITRRKQRFQNLGIKVSDAIYTIDDLSSLSGASPRTIRLWIQKRLVPKAYPLSTNVSYRPCYGKEHLDAIRKVQLIREAQMTLADIKDHLYPEEDA